MISVDLTAQRGSFPLRARWESDCRSVGIFGPSGCGKTTLLYALAGLLKPSRGRIRIENETWFNSDRGIHVPPQEREVGFVFQDARLFPHWSAGQNLVASVPGRNTAGPAFDEIVSFLQLEGLLDRSVNDLSGGEQKRVALGRALLRRPRLLILDEPLTGLDSTLRRRIMGYLLSLKDSLNIPVLYVSHTFSDLLALTDWVVFMNAGRVSGEANPGDALGLLQEPETIETTLSCRVLEHETTGSLVQSDGLTLTAPRVPAPPGSTAHLTIKAEDCILAPSKPPPTSARNCFEAKIIRLVPSEERSLVELDAGPRFWAELTPRSVQEMKLAPGGTVWVLLKVRALRTGP